MPCRTQIQEGLEKEITTQSEELIGTNFPLATKNAKEINKRFGYDVVSVHEGENEYINNIRVNIPDELVEEYYQSELKIEIKEAKNIQQEDAERIGEEQSDDYMMQKNDISSQASPKTISMLKDFIKRIGVNINNVEGITLKNGNANGVALLMQKLIQVVNGKEASTLPEEAMHFAVVIIKQTNPILYNKLLSEINQYQMLRDVFTTYGNDYKTKEGKPDVIKLKEEAIAKVLAETVIKQSEGVLEKPELLAKTLNWWQSIVDFLKGLFTKSGFDKLAMDIISGKEIGTAENINENTEFFQKDVQPTLVDNIDNIASQITLKENQTDEKENGYYINGKKIPRRVTDVSKAVNKEKFKNIIKSDYQIEVETLKAEKGTKLHTIFNYAFHKLTDENGYLRATSLDDSDYETQFPDFSREKYEILKENLVIRLASLDVNPLGKTKFRSEITVYDIKRNIAGTIDLLAVEADGKVHVFDWKFMNLNINKYDDIPWFKIDEWKTQMGQYVRILQDAYGIKFEQLGQTRMIPILTVYSSGNVKEHILPILTEIRIGAVDPKKITDDYLLPVGLETEKTGNRKIDKLLERLNAEYKKLADKIVTPEEGQKKKELLNALFKGIRHLQIRGEVSALLNQSKLLNEEIQRLINSYNITFKDKDASLFSEEQRNKFAENIQNYQDAIDVYTTLYSTLKTLFTEEDKKLKKDLRRTSEKARDMQTELNEILDEFTEQHIAMSEKVGKFLSPEKVIKGIPKWFSTTAILQSKSLEVLYKKANRAFGFAAMDTLNENKKLEELKTAYDSWAKGKGLNKKNYFGIIKKKTKNELVDQYNSKFYYTLKGKIEEKDFKWIKENINAEEYKQFLDGKLKEEINRILNKTDLYTEAEYAQIERVKENNGEGPLPFKVKQEIDKAKQLYNTSSFDSPGWLLYQYTRQFPKNDWLSEEWVELNKLENKPARDFYDYILERNIEYQKLGYITKGEARVFLPFVRRSLTEKIMIGGRISFGEQFLRNISLDEGDIGFGRIDPLSGKPINSIPKYFTNDIEGELSEDLFKTMSMYNEAALKYKYIKTIEYQITALVNTEKNKKAIATSMFGKTQYKNGELQYTPDNNENSKLVEDMMKAIVYDQKYITSETFDQLLGKLGTWGETFNKKLGVKIFPENLSERQLSVNKIITQLNNTFQLNTLGLNLLSASSNLFGGNAQSMINAGTYFTKTDYIASEMTLFMNKFNSTDQKKMIGALEYFLPLTENYNRELSKHLSIATLTAESLQDGLMYFMRQSDWNVQYANFYAYLKNSVVINGQIVNARVYLSTQPKYEHRYNGASEQRKSLKEEFEKEVKALIEEKGVLKLSEIVDNRFVIKGVDQHSESVIELRRKVQQINKDALGNLTPDDLRTINMQIYGKSFMVFKNWIPRLIDIRLGNMKYNSALEVYEWGRTRMVFRILSEDIFKGLGRLKNALLVNDKGVKYMRELYEKKKSDYEDDTGKTLNMTEEEFIDLVKNNVKNEAIDVVFLLIMFSLVAGLEAIPPDEDEEEYITNQYKFVVRMVNKFKSELSYFYDPTSLTGLVSKGIFPSIALIDNFSKGLKNFFIENWALATGNEELEKSNKVIKYWMKTFPFTNQMVGYLPMFYPTLAKDLGIKIQANYSIKY